MSSNGISGQESLAGTQYHGVVVAIDFEGTEKRGEARVRIESLHGDATETPDEYLPIAIFDIKNSTDTFGTFNIGDKVTVEFPKGGRSTPVITGKTMNMDSLKKVIPEYEENYGQVRGTYSQTAECAIFINEATGTIHLRFLDGSDLQIKKGEITGTSKGLTFNIDGAVNVTSKTATVNTEGNVSVKAGGNANVEADGNLVLKGAMIMEN